MKRSHIEPRNKPFFPTWTTCASSNQFIEPRDTEDTFGYRNKPVPWDSHQSQGYLLLPRNGRSVWESPIYRCRHIPQPPPGPKVPTVPWIQILPPVDLVKMVLDVPRRRFMRSINSKYIYGRVVSWSLGRKGELDKRRFGGDVHLCDWCGFVEIAGVGASANFWIDVAFIASPCFPTGVGHGCEIDCEV